MHVKVKSLSQQEKANVFKFNLTRGGESFFFWVCLSWNNSTFDYSYINPLFCQKNAFRLQYLINICTRFSFFYFTSLTITLLLKMRGKLDFVLRENDEVSIYMGNDNILISPRAHTQLLRVVRPTHLSVCKSWSRTFFFSYNRKNYLHNKREEIHGKLRKIQI